MLQRAVTLKSYLQNLQVTYTQVMFTQGEWSQIEDSERVLKKPYMVTKTLQLQELTPGQFFYEWKKLDDFLSKDNTRLATSISQAMREREENLFKNKILLAAVYVDPRSRDLLSTQQQQQAISNFVDIAVHINRTTTISIPQQTSIQNQNLPSETINVLPNSGGSDDSFEIRLNELARQRIQKEQQERR